MTDKNLAESCKNVLIENDKGKFTIPAKGLYPHQWLWDSCFIAIGQRHYDVSRAQQEILSLLRGQWSNGMLPNMILAPSKLPSQATTFWRSNLSPLSPDNVATSGITQPPMLAEAVVKVGEKLNSMERHSWYQQVYPAILHFHQWLYNERDPKNQGLVLQIHPWETGLDNTPPWIQEINQQRIPLWIKIIGFLHLDTPIGLLRKDSFLALPGERISTLNALTYYSIQRRLRRKRYEIKSILNKKELAVQDINFNSILVRANHHLSTIAKYIDKNIPDELLSKIQQTKKAFDLLWDAYSGQYYSRSYLTNKLIKIPTLGTLLPLYAGNISKERAKQLVDLLNDKKQFSCTYPIPTVPLNSKWFDEHKYWQGPTWINTNWLIIDGLKRYGYLEEAEHIRKQTLALVANSGSSEYFSPKDGSPAGADNFSWTAALCIDLLNNTSN